MTPEEYAALREPFPPAMIGTNPDGMDFVGHAAVTDRLNQVDPNWTWDFITPKVPAITLRKFRDGVDKKGQPYEVHIAGMWITFTICGVTRPAYGEVEQYPWTTDVEKQLISDALKNGAMRCGVALDLWAKQDLHAPKPVVAVTGYQVQQIADVFAGVEDEAARKHAQTEWKGRFGPVSALPASMFDAAYAAAMDLAEAETVVS